MPNRYLSADKVYLSDGTILQDRQIYFANDNFCIISTKEDNPTITWYNCNQIVRIEGVEAQPKPSMKISTIDGRW